MQRFKDPKFMIIIAMAIFGTLGPFVRNISVSSGELALYRVMVGGAILGCYFLFTKQGISFSKIKKELPLLIISGAALGFNWIFLFQAYKYTTIATATLSYYFAPIIVTLLCPVLFKERLTAKQILCFIASTAGIVLITGIGGGISSSDLIGIFLGLIAAVLYAVIVLLNKFIKNVSGLHRTFLQFLIAIIALLPYVAVTSGVTLGTMNRTGWICLLIVCVVHTSISYCLYFTALKDLPGQKAAILSYIDPLVAVVISVTILGEPMTLQQIIGGILILGFTLLNEITPAKKK